MASGEGALRDGGATTTSLSRSSFMRASTESRSAAEGSSRS
jgi:hypothetical protein